MYNLYTICSAALVSGIRKISSNNLRNVQYVNTVQCNFFRKNSTFPQTSHRIKDTLQRYLIPWLRPFTVSFLYKDPPSPPPPPQLSDQLPGERTPQGLPYLGFPVGTMNLFAMHIFHKCYHPPGTLFTDPRRDGSGALTCYLSHKSQTRY